MPDWPHAPIHRLDERGAYIVTAGTYQKERLFSTPDRLQMLHDALLEVIAEHGWHLQAWCVLANHYHILALSPDDPTSLRRAISKIHTLTAKRINELDREPGRRVWFQYWDAHVTYQRSYLARMKYVHHNPVHHGVVQMAAQYPWCSAAWFEREADPAFRNVVESFKIDCIHVMDDF